MKTITPVCDAEDVAQLFGTTRAKLLSRVKAGRFAHKPSAKLNGSPIWNRSAIEEACNEHWSAQPAGMVWLHPRTWASADAAAQELIFYRHCGAVIYQSASGAFAIHIPATSRPARVLRMLKRYGANIDWQLREFKPNA
jgi:hypothetical protein